MTALIQLDAAPLIIGLVLFLVSLFLIEYAHFYILMSSNAFDDISYIKMSFNAVRKDAQLGQKNKSYCGKAHFRKIKEMISIHNYDSLPIRNGNVHWRL
jgi:hypothetical protein